MSKRAIISISIIAFILVLIGVLFSTVFCLRSQKVTVLGESPVTISKEDIVRTAELKNGQSIFMLDKTRAVNKIEATYPFIKVVQIKTISVTEVDIQIRARHKMCYTKANNNYFILDEEFKVLDIVEANLEGQESNEPINLIRIEEGSLNIDSSTMVCDFVGTDYQKQVGSELCSAIMNNVKEKTDETTEYYSRADVREIIKDINFEENETSNKIILTTVYGVKLDIESPTKDLTYKMNICLSTVKKFISDASNKEKSGTIKIYYDINGHQHNVYIPETNN